MCQALGDIFFTTPPQRIIFSTVYRRILKDMFLLPPGDDVQFVLIPDLSGMVLKCSLPISQCPCPPDRNLSSLTPAQTHNSALLWIHQKWSSHWIALTSNADPAEVWGHLEDGGHLSLCTDSNGDTRSHKIAPLLLQSPSSPKLSAEALVFPQLCLPLACPDSGFSPPNRFHFSLLPRTEQLTLPWDPFSTHVPSCASVISKNRGCPGYRAHCS